jgi:Protein of unknown function (DUF3313)
MRYGRLAGALQELALIACAAALSAGVIGCGLLETALEPPLPGHGALMTHEPGEPAPPPLVAAPPSAFFAHPQLLEARAGVPFQKVWIKPGADLGRFDQLAVAPVSLAYLQPMAASAADGLSPSDQKGPALDAAVHINDAIAGALRRDPIRHFHLIDSPLSGSLVLEVAIVQLDPVGLNRAVPASSARSEALVSAAERSAAGSGVIGLDARITDGPSGETLAMFSARRGAAEAAPGDRWGFVNGAIDGWARDLIATLDSQPR